MDRTVPAGAAILLDFIRKTEVGRDDRASYDVIYGHNQNKLPKPVTSMTIDEVIAAQSGWSKRFGSSATGGYQFMRATLTDLKKELRLRGSQKLDPDLQDRLGYHLLKRRGYEAFIAGKISCTEFGRRLAMEWASFPVLAATDGSKRPISRGQSYYAGDGLNKALVKPEAIEAVLDRVKSVAKAPVQPNPKIEPIPQPEPVPSTPSAAGTGILAAIVAALATSAAYITNLPCQVLGIFCGG